MADPLSFVLDSLTIIFNIIYGTLSAIGSVLAGFFWAILAKGGEFGIVGILIALGIAALVTFFIAKLIMASWKKAVFMFFLVLAILLAIGMFLV